VNGNELLEVDVAILVLIVLGPNRATVFIEGSCLLRYFFGCFRAIYVNSTHIEENSV
jgi:hypothetical protein